MKQRNAMIAVWAALLIAVGIALSLSTTNPDSSGGGAVADAQKKAGGTTTAIRPWPEAIEVRLFVEDLSYDERERIGATMSNPKGVMLNRDQRATLDNSVTLYRMTHEEYENSAYAACFIPHHFFRYYDSNGKQLGELAVCYCCGGIRLRPALREIRRDEEWQFDYEAVKTMLEGMNIPTNVHCGRDA